MNEQRITRLSDYLKSGVERSAKEFQELWQFGYNTPDDKRVMDYVGGVIEIEDNGTYTLVLYNQSFVSPNLDELVELLWDGYGKWEGGCLTEEELLEDLNERIAEFRTQNDLPDVPLSCMNVFLNEGVSKQLEYLMHVEFDILDFIK